MATEPLTERQQKVFDSIIEFLKARDRWPTNDEVADLHGFKSLNSVTQYYQAFVEKGYFVKVGWGNYDLHPTKKYLLREDAGLEEYGIPIKGIIAAGGMHEAVESDLGRITLDTIFPRIDRLFAVRVSGNSMVEEGIEDGDLVLLARGEVADGDVGAVLYRRETSLKRVYRYSYGLRLEPANRDHEPIKIEPDEFEQVEILGRYVGHVDEKGIHKA